MITSTKKPDRPVEFDEDYPCLKILQSDDRGHRGANGTVVLFTRPKTGVVVYTTDRSKHEIGYRSKSWDEAEFSIYTDEVILRNLQL